MEVKKILAACDHTLLLQTATWEEIKVICDDAMTYKTASICIPPCYIEKAKEYVGDRVKICTVIGFPNGNMTKETKVFETKDALEKGADEIDMVINIGMLKAGEYAYVLEHERYHIQRGDLWFRLLAMTALCIHWFNPLVWIAASMSRTDSELRCDDRVTQPMNQEERKSYASVLVLAAARRNAPGLGVLATGMTMTGKRLKTRVATVMQNRKPLRWLTISFAILSSMCLIGAFATSETKEQLEMGVGWPVDEHTLAEALSSNRHINNENDAIVYARELCERYWTGDGGGVFDIGRFFICNCVQL